MANVVTGNSIYLDSTGTPLSTKARVFKLILTPTSANGILILTSGTMKVDVRAATSGESKVVDFGEHPLLFESGITVDTITNANATLIYNKG